MQQPKQFHLEFKWSAPLDPLMTTSNLLGVASDESEDGLSREHSLGSDDQLLFSDTESVPSSNKGASTPKKTMVEKTTSGKFLLALNPTTMSIWMTIILVPRINGQMPRWMPNQS